jgi:hypothetical protein
MCSLVGMLARAATAPPPFAGLVPDSTRPCPTACNPGPGERAPTGDRQPDRTPPRSGPLTTETTGPSRPKSPARVPSNGRSSP